ncbi:MAG: hypothetical protein K8R59_15060 [Thermoanaerobaculales bacterium]|nr:hypothetical protein [Thermoanaerobaculales bacterium]
MKREFSIRCFAVAVMACLILAVVPASAQVNDYDRPISKTEFVTGVYGAIMGQVRSTVDPVEALGALQERGMIPTVWDGEETITMGEAEQVFNQMGIQLYVPDPDVLLNSGNFEQILRTHEGEIKKMKQHWDIVHHFTMGLELGEYRERIISGSGF